MCSAFLDDRLGEPVTENPWESLRKFTDARIALGRSGSSLPTKHLLDFQLAHARARDAVHLPLDVNKVLSGICEQAWPSPEAIALHSKAENRWQYLQRPDYGRALSVASEKKLQSLVMSNKTLAGADLAIVVADGLSARAIEQNTVKFLQAFFNLLEEDEQSWTYAPICLVEQGRVAVGDQIGEILKARCLVLLVGERPGLSSPDSMGLYLTWAPKAGLTDASRNCISNIRPEGISYKHAARKAHYLVREARNKKLSGVQLKDRSNESLTGPGQKQEILPIEN